MSKKISIIIATFNAGATLKQAINSVNNQSLRDIELVIIDGGSKDTTCSIIEQNSHLISYWESTPDNGIYDALNKGIKKVKGDWILFLGADDLLFSDTILQEIFSMPSLTKDTKLIYGKALYVKKGNIYGESKDIFKLINSNICHQSIFYHKNLFKELDGFNLKYSVLADYEFNLRVFKRYAEHTLFTDKVICKFNDVGETTSRTVLDKNFHTDMLKRFCKEWHIYKYNPILHQYYFYRGIYLIKSSPSIHIHGLISLLTGIFLSGKRFLFFIALSYVLLYKKKLIIR